ncbi:MAG: M48 family metallopeptidase [Bacteroidales bacterium]|nr:M48 family metallopeptidase [Bacteroidales bacterium]
MKKTFKLLTASLLVSLVAFACSTVPLTNRSRVEFIPHSEMNAMSFEQYDIFLKENRLSRNQYKTKMVKQVGKKIEAAVTRYLYDNNYAELLDGYAWEFNTVESDQVNAWAMPGGKVVVYTGILPITEDETGLAVVIGHEIAHAIAEHGNERMSQELLRQAGGVALSVALQNNPEQTRNYWLAAYGLGSEVGVMLPFSRLHESEADHLGLIFMAMAGYNPEEAPAFWERMSQVGGEKPPEFLSTHPSDETRINNLRKWMPEALEYYEKSR